jgi:geranylgeranyl pyrophosphate synthase
MAAGQTFDISTMHDQSINSEQLLDIYRLKTGALLTACLELGYHASDDTDVRNLQALQTFGNHIGLAFQIQDDILDIESTAATLGKPQGLDARNEKITYPKLVGLLQAKADVDTHYQKALNAIAYLGENARLLRDLTSYLLGRNK